MDHELAKQLKDAGFPQLGNGKYVGNVGNINNKALKPGDVFGIAQEDFFYIPTLSELIEAVGTDGDKPIFKFLSNHCKRTNDLLPTPNGKIDMSKHGRWNARARTNEHKEDSKKWKSVNGWGHTPEEAVAKLCLELHKDRGLHQ